MTATRTVDKAVVVKGAESGEVNPEESGEVNPVESAAVTENDDDVCYIITLSGERIPRDDYRGE